MWKWIKNLFTKPAQVAVSKQANPVNDTPSTSGKGYLWYPKAVMHKRAMKTRGTYSGGYPKGAVVHFTSGRYEGGLAKAKDSIDGGIENGFAFLCIGNDGSIVQAHPLDKWGYHAGESAWKGLAGTVSDDLVGIEMNNAGKVDKISDNKFKTWFGTYLTSDEVRYVTEKDYGCPTGYYHKYTPAQEETLIEFLVWLKKNDKTGNFKIDFILGHHEVAGKLGIGYFRKNDPGGSLSMSMDELRRTVKKKCEA